jgi:hypothetical protein
MEHKRVRSIGGAIGVFAVTVALSGVASAMAPPGEAPTATCSSHSGYFCAYRDSQFGGQLLISSAPAGSTVDVVDNQVSSAKNQTANYWCGMDSPTGALVFSFAPYTNINYVGDPSNDKIDYFRVRSNGCP